MGVILCLNSLNTNVNTECTPASWVLPLWNVFFYLCQYSANMCVCVCVCVCVFVCVSVCVLPANVGLFLYVLTMFESECVHVDLHVCVLLR